MKRFFLTLLLTTVCYYSQSQNLNISGNTEPQSIFKVSIHGKTYDVSENDELKLDTLILNPTISIKLSDYKIFETSAISFEYPRHLSYEFEQDFGFKNWTFSGNNMVILVFEIDAETTLTSLINEMVKKFGKKNCVIEDFQKKLGHKMLDGKKLFVSLVGQNLVLECYEIKLNDFKSRFIYFQDTLDENKHSNEYEKGLSMINSTIIFK